MKKILGLMALGLGMIFLSGCGSDDNDDTPIVQQTIQGTVVGSHYEGAWVCVDSNSNARCDGEETITVSDANGNWKLDYPYTKELSVVAEIYVDNIKHSNYSTPPETTLVEKPMIFLAPLQGEVNNQLIVSPISTMVYRSMQENGTSFQIAKESVANELGVSSEALLTNYNVENPSADHIALQQHSAVETEKLGLSMTYHNNYVTFDYEYAGQAKSGGRYTIKDFYVPSAQDPNHHIYINKVVDLELTGDDSARLDFVLGREGSSNVATWWKNRVSSDENIYNRNPDKLNFAFTGYLTLNIDGKYYVFSDLFLAQGKGLVTLFGNDWILGSRNCSYNDSAAALICNAKDENGNAVKFKFSYSSGTLYGNTLEIYRWESSPKP